MKKKKEESWDAKKKRIRFSLLLERICMQNNVAAIKFVNFHQYDVSDELLYM
jgi:hypothetical protein